MVKSYSSFSFIVISIHSFPAVSNLLQKYTKYMSHLKILDTRKVT